MRRPKTMTLVIMGGGLATLGAVSLGATSGGHPCQAAPTQPGAPPAATSCTHTSGGGFYLGSWRSWSGGSDASTSARGGFGASGSAHAGE